MLWTSFAHSSRFRRTLSVPCGKGSVWPSRRRIGFRGSRPLPSTWKIVCAIVACIGGACGAGDHMPPAGARPTLRKLTSKRISSAITTSTVTGMNRLAQETSPYLLQHAHNPVDWYAWGEEAFERARAEDKPVLLSIGYSACHWCHVMERESFEDEGTARLMNDRFVNIKVDREERPDVDAVYMDAVVALTGQGGWPMTVFLTPAGEPFFGGTYYPPEPRQGMPAFRQVLSALANAYRDQRDDVAQQAAALVDHLQHSARTLPSEDPLNEALLDQAVQALRMQYDPTWGGFGRAPKFPPASTIEFLLRRGAFEMALGTLDGMRAGGMHDLVGGGFHRYSVDEQWLIPHFEKMLYDNALLVPAYLHAYLLTQEGSYREIVEQTLDYAIRELRLDGGGFASAQDADTDGVEGLTFTWTPTELADAIGADRDLLLQPFEHGRYVLRGHMTEE